MLAGYRLSEAKRKRNEYPISIHTHVRMRAHYNVKESFQSKTLCLLLNLCLRPESDLPLPLSKTSMRSVNFFEIAKGMEDLSRTRPFNILIYCTNLKNILLQNREAMKCSLFIEHRGWEVYQFY